MANISRETFNKMKHYVSVRLQQGVPLVDADWNEMEDIRRFELQAFLKWFVGDGVPVGNDGFRIVGIAGQIVLTSKKIEIEIEIDLNPSTAAETLGFYNSNCRASRWFPPAAQLIGKNTGPFSDLVGKTLVIKTHNPGELEWSTDTVAFQAGDFHDSNQATAAEVVAAINRAIHLKATVGEQNDFTIQGGDGTPEGAGRCLVEGWDVINDSDLCYTGQRLYGNDALAEAWKVNKLPQLTVPDQDRTDLVYLDVWEREVNKDEDAELENPKIGVPTCVRFKREWVVRVAEDVSEDTSTFPDTFLKKEGHVYYPLARITHKGYRDIVDLRRKGLAALSQELTIKDGNVGIGTTAPNAKLDVHGDLALYGPLKITGQAGIGTTNPTSQLYVAGNVRWHIGTLNSKGTTVTGTSTKFQSQLCEADTIIIDNGQARLITQILDETHLTIDQAFDSDITYPSAFWSVQPIMQLVDFTGVSQFLVTADGKIGIGTITPGAKLAIAVDANDTDTKPFTVGKGTTNYLTISNSGNVGIGATTPTAKLAVVESFFPTGSFLATGGNYAGKFSAITEGDGKAVSLNILATSNSKDKDHETKGIQAHGEGNGPTTAGEFTALGKVKIEGNNEGDNEKEIMGIYAEASGKGTGPKYGIRAKAWGNGQLYAGYFDGNVTVNGVFDTNILAVGVPTFGQLNPGDAVITGNLIAGNVGMGGISK